MSLGNECDQSGECYRRFLLALFSCLEEGTDSCALERPELGARSFFMTGQPWRGWGTWQQRPLDQKVDS
jgi:hypothetical protein